MSRSARRLIRIVTVVLVVAFLAGFVVQPSQAQTGEIIHTVQRGETLQTIARLYGTTWQAIATRNNLANPNLIYVGQQLVIPRSTITPIPHTYVVQRGDTLRNIATRHGTTWQNLAAINNLANPNHIYVGQVLRLTGTVVQPPPQPPAHGRTHVVRPGDTISSIARWYGVDMWNLARANNILNLNLIYVGQVLWLP